MSYKYVELGLSPLVWISLSEPEDRGKSIIFRLIVFHRGPSPDDFELELNLFSDVLSSTTGCNFNKKDTIRVLGSFSDTLIRLII